MEVILEDVPLLDAGVDGERLRVSDVPQGLVISGGLALNVHRKVGALHFTGWSRRAAAWILGQMVKFVQRRCSTFQVLADTQEEIGVGGGGGRKLLTTVAAG